MNVLQTPFNHSLKQNLTQNLLIGLQVPVKESKKKEECYPFLSLICFHFGGSLFIWLSFPFEAREGMLLPSFSHLSFHFLPPVNECVH